MIHLIPAFLQPAFLYFSTSAMTLAHSFAVQSSQFCVFKSEACFDFRRLLAARRCVLAAHWRVLAARRCVLATCRRVLVASRRVFTLDQCRRALKTVASCPPSTGL